MKKILLFLILFCTIPIFAQIKVLKNENLVEIGKENSVGLYKKANRYTINYQDINTSNLNTFRSLTFLDVNGAVLELYKLITDGFIDLPSDAISLELPNDLLELKFEKNYGQPTVQFIQYFNKNKKLVGKSQFLTKKQIDKIFGVGTPKAAYYNKNATQTNSNSKALEPSKKRKRK